MEQQEVTQVTEVYEKERRLICDTTFSQNELSTTGIVLAIKQWRLDQSTSSKGIWKDSDSQKLHMFVGNWCYTWSYRATENAGVENAAPE